MSIPASATLPFPGATVLHVYDDNMNGPVKFYIGIIADAVFVMPDGCASQDNGWSVVKMTEKTWQAFYGRFCQKNRITLGGEPRPLKADGTNA